MLTSRVWAGAAVRSSAGLAMASMTTGSGSLPASSRHSEPRELLASCSLGFFVLRPCVISNDIAGSFFITEMTEKAILRQFDIKLYAGYALKIS